VNNRSSVVCLCDSPGRALALALAKRGVQVSVLDLASQLGEETVRVVAEEHARVGYKPTSPSAIFIKCDVSNTGMIVFLGTNEEKRNPIKSPWSINC